MSENVHKEIYSVRKFALADVKKANFLTGFTLVEMIITVLLVGVLAAAVMPRLGGMGVLDQLKTRARAHEIAVDMGHARRLAITNSQDYEIKFNTGLGTYDITTGTPPQSIGVDFPKTIPSNISISGTKKFEFQKLGNAKAGGTLIVTCGTHIYNVTVDAVTGSVKMH